MPLELGDALEAFELADQVELDCGKFTIKIARAAMDNEGFRAAVTRRAMRRRRKSLVPQEGTLTGSYEEDVALYIEHVLKGWGSKPLKDSNGAEVDWTKENLTELFCDHPGGRVLFGKIMTAASGDDLFRMREEDDLGN